LSSTIKFWDFKSIAAEVSLDKKFNQFSVDKLEMKSGAHTLETSLNGFIPGQDLKLAFKGDSNSKSNLSATYKLPIATLTGEIDIKSFSNFKASACSSINDFTAGANCEFEGKASNMGLKDFGLGLSFKKKEVFAALKVTDKLSKALAHFQYALNKEVGLVGSVKYDTQKKDTEVFVGAKYACNPATLLKLKLGTDKKVNFSAKHKLDTTSTVTGAVCLDLANLPNYKYGVIASLG
jgi:hypothetical protein